MTQWDIEYLKLCRKILREGVEVENRTGINTIKIPEYYLSFDLSKEFPILTTKQLYYRAAVTEILWIWQMQSNNVMDLTDRNVKIWNEWRIDNDGIYRIYEPQGEYDPDKEVEVIDPMSVPMDDPFGINHEFDVKRDESGKVLKAKSLIEGKTIKAAKWYGKEYAGTIGTAYGFITNRYKFAETLIETIKKKPTDRRMVKSLWQDEFLRTAVLPSCVWATEWDVTDGKLNLFVHQRSCDVPLGLPFNVTQYAALLMMMAQATNLKPGVIKHSIKDPHIYVNQVDGIKEQLRRGREYSRLSHKNPDELLKIKNELSAKMELIEDKDSEKYLLLDTKYRILDMILDPVKPKMWLNPEIANFFDFDNSKELKDVKLLKYKHMGKINFPIAQ